MDKKTLADFNGVVLPIYDRERTICDCFKYRSKLDHEIYAKKLRVYKKVNELMSVLLDG